MNPNDIRKNYLRPGGNTAGDTATATAKLVKYAAKTGNFVRWIGSASPVFKIALEATLFGAKIIKKYFTPKEGIDRDIEIIKKKYDFIESGSKKMDNYLSHLTKQTNALQRDIDHALKSLQQQNPTPKINLNSNVQRPIALQQSVNSYFKNRHSFYFFSDFEKDFDSYTKNLDEVGNAVTNLSKNISALEESIKKLQLNRDNAYRSIQQLKSLDRDLRDLEKEGIISLTKAADHVLQMK